MMYMLIPEICSEHASLLYILASASHLGPCTISIHCYKEIIISNYSYNKICDEYTVDILLPLNTIGDFLQLDSSTSRGSIIKMLPTFGHITAKIQ
jgi:hypothetical protein